MMAWRLAVLISASLGIANAAYAQDEPKVSFSGYVQPQYQVEFHDGSTTDRALLRRVMLTTDVVLSKNWRGELQADLGPVASGGDRVIVKNMFLRYTGWEESRGITITAGNQKLPFSRSFLTSSSKRGLVERPFTGDRGFGSPGRALSLKVDGWHIDKRAYWSAAVAESQQSGEPDEIRLDGTAEAGSDGFDGRMLVARVEAHPLGEVPRDHGDFERGPFRFTAGAAAYRWWNDGDAGEDESGGLMAASRVTGLELSGGLRGGGVSIDVEFEQITARSRDVVPDTGIFLDGEVDLLKASLEAGYMIVREHLEALVAVDGVETDAFARPWRRTALGMNWYVRRHALKFSLMHRESFNHRGDSGARSRAVYLQTQFAF